MITPNIKQAGGRYLSLLSTIVLLLAVASPLMLFHQASAAQITTRSIRTTSSNVGQAGVTYNVSFNPATSTGTGADDIRGIIVEFCQDSPLIGGTCTKTNGVTGIAVSGTVAVAHTGATGTPVSFTANDPTGTTYDGNTLVLTNATGLDVVTPANPITFNFTATNPNGTIATSGNYGTYYARILTFNTTAGATSYTSTTPGTHLDDGGVALSTAKQLQVSARVQEQLEFCVAALPNTVNSNATAPANCSATDFANATATTAVDLGVVDSGSVAVSPVAPANGGNNRNGGVMVRTNASSGAAISYFAEQNTSSGKLKVPGATCSGTSSTDQCFNSAGATQANFQTTVAGEKFGMTAGQVLRPTGSTTTNLTRDTDYDGNGTANSTVCTPGTVDSPSCFAWVDTGTNNPAEGLAASSAVLDYEMLVLNFAARAAATTPTGSYTVTSTYIATSTF